MSEQEEINVTPSNPENPEQSITWQGSCPPNTTVSNTTVSILYPNQYYSHIGAYTVASTATASVPIRETVRIGDAYETTDLDVRMEEITRRIVSEEMAKHERRIRQNILDDLRKEVRLKTGRRAE